MADDSVGKYTGEGIFDVTSYKDKLVDVKSGELNKFRRSKPGLARVLNELAKAIPEHGDEARIHAKTYQEILEIVVILALIRKDAPGVAKLSEILRESEVYYEDKLETLISRLGKSVIDTAQDDKKPGLLAIFEETLAYRSMYADKAAATRKKNEAAAQEGKPTTSDGQEPAGS
ncbi:hypothetical protein [Polyangium jinanense]|uniref:Uncharacterized protein n=1 Tax=Polyangium jinanense TaxID=2829994 RepID=A0A9X3XDS8_9BACT|nr:hypothetical protein [Polyangium jinanense]MDC3960028.1 hypothetical protein [Polyangium jinanense]MDC3986246.1 hypothetical protein [Polyangium jinanense]